MDGLQRFFSSPFHSGLKKILKKNITAQLIRRLFVSLYDSAESVEWRYELAATSGCMPPQCHRGSHRQTGGMVMVVVGMVVGNHRQPGGIGGVVGSHRQPGGIGGMVVVGSHRRFRCRRAHP
jgi:hypothetical protein